MKDPGDVLKGMGPWLEERGTATSARGRTARQQGWDSAVLTCSEFVRRLMEYDEAVAGELHLLLTSIIAPAEARRG